MDPQVHLERVAVRMTAAGFDVTPSLHVAGTAVLLGQTSAFRWRWMATRLHLLMYVQAGGAVTVDRLEQLTVATMEHALASKGALRGLQVGVAAVPVLIGAQVDEGARQYAEHHILRRYAGFAWPVVIDATSGAVHRHTGRPAVGSFYTSWMKEQIDTATLDR